MSMMINVIVIFVKIIIYIAGGLLIFWSLICFLGGPDGHIGTLESIGYGFLFLVIGGIIIQTGRWLGKKLKINKND
jgi:hypothetical protein